MRNGANKALRKYFRFRERTRLQRKGQGDAESQGRDIQRSMGPWTSSSRENVRTLKMYEASRGKCVSAIVCFAICVIGVQGLIRPSLEDRRD